MSDFRNYSGLGDKDLLNRKKSKEREEKETYILFIEKQILSYPLSCRSRQEKHSA